MAFAAAITFLNTIQRLLTTSSSISVVAPSREIIESAYKVLKSLQETLKRLDSSSKGSSRKRVNALDEQIRETVSKFEDVLESHVSNQIHAQSEESINGDMIQFSVDLLDLRQDVDSFARTVKQMEEDYVKELDNPLPEEDDDGINASSSAGLGGKKSKMVGLSDVLSKIRDLLTVPNYPGFPVFSLVGMAGIGKTILAQQIFQDPLVSSHFDCRVWVTVGRECQLNKISLGILAQLGHDTDKILAEREKEVAQYLYESLKDRRCFIVLDDVWETDVWDCLKNSFTDNIDVGSRILLTTRLQEVAQHTRVSSFGIVNTIRLLNKGESWDLLHKKVFGKDSCPPQLEKAGKKIAENCEGLPLMIVTVADLLSKDEKTPEYWNKVAEKQNSLFEDAYDELSDVLFPSYNYLCQHLKPCFLYLGVFNQNYEIPLSKLINMWIAEGFLEPNMIGTLEDCAVKCLDELFSNSLVIICQRSINWRYKSANHIKTCRLHSSFWHLCNREAEKNKFFHVLNTRKDGLEEGIKGQYRLCIRNNILLGIKDMHNLMEDDCASTIRSLLCFGSYHQYPVPIYSELRLLRVLDALNIRFYVFPLEVLKLFQLRYLAFTYNGKLPASISKLQNLQFLIIHPHLSIKSCEAPSYVPIEIWDMQELKHIQIMGSNLPDSNCGSYLENLSTLLGVSTHSFTKGVLEGISNIKKLGIQIELTPDDDDSPFHCLTHISHLNKLESLKCIVVNPELMPKVVGPPAPLYTFPSSLRKVHLSGLGYPWECMNIVSSLPHLNVLKLRNYAFRGPTWEINESEFRMLKFLVIEDTDLVQWKVGISSFPRLRHLSLKHCYKLEKFHWDFDYFFIMVEILDSNPSSVNFINQIKSRRGRSFRDVNVHSSWDDRKLKS